MRMLDLLRQKLSGSVTNEDKINKVREFLQIFILKIMFDRGFIENLAFVGGTALRVLYGLKRYSEDLDFTLIKKKGYKFETLIKQLSYELKKSRLKVETTINKEKIVQDSFVKFPGLLYELGLSELKGQKLAIRVEIDINPPSGWKATLHPVTADFVFALRSFDLPSLYATKLHACFFRKYTKGRDFYDLLWYLGKKIEPNYKLLNNSISQTTEEKMRVNSKNFSLFLRDKLSRIDFKLVRRDVSRFLEDKRELKLLNRNTILKMLH